MANGWTKIGGGGGSGGSGSIAVEEAGSSIVAAATTIDFKDSNVEDDGSGQAGVYQNLPPLCQGRLTLTSGTAVTTADVTAATSLYFTPLGGSQVSLFDGTRWKKYAFTELTLAVPGTTTTMYDVYLYDNAGTLTLEATAWTNDTTRATALTTQDGIYVKTGATTRRYLGSVRTTGVSGQTEDSETRRYLWNLYNPAMRTLFARETTDSWSYGTDAWRAVNNVTTEGVTRFSCVIGVNIRQLRVHARCALHKEAGSSGTGSAGVGIDSTTVTSARIYGIPVASDGYASDDVQYLGYPGIGYHYIQWLERTNGTNFDMRGDSGVPNNIQAGMEGWFLA